MVGKTHLVVFVGFHVCQLMFFFGLVVWDSKQCPKVTIFFMLFPFCFGMLTSIFQEVATLPWVRQEPVGEFFGEVKIHPGSVGRMDAQNDKGM